MVIVVGVTNIPESISSGYDRDCLFWFSPSERASPGVG